MSRFSLAVFLAASMLFGAVGVLMIESGFDAPAAAATDEGALPLEVFAAGQKVRGGGAVYEIEEVRGQWVKARLYRSLDGHNAPPTVSRWLYIPAMDTAWSVSD